MNGQPSAIAGVELVVCDLGVYKCGSMMRTGTFNGKKTKRADGVIVFAMPVGPSGSFCPGYKDLPTIAVETSQPPCEVAFTGPNDAEMGHLGGAAMGRHAKDDWGCDITAYVSLESASRRGNADRMGGFRNGFGESCPIDPATEVILDVGSRANALEQVSALLPTLPGDHIVVVAIDDEAILGALEAARTVGREIDLIDAGLGGGSPSG